MTNDFPLQPGESRGTDLAETLSELGLRQMQRARNMIEREPWDKRDG